MNTFVVSYINTGIYIGGNQSHPHSHTHHPLESSVTHSCADSPFKQRAVGSQSPLHIHLNIGPVLFHLCLCALLRPHSIIGLAHALPSTPLLHLLLICRTACQRAHFCGPPLQKAAPPSCFLFSYSFSRLAHSFFFIF